MKKKLLFFMCGFMAYIANGQSVNGVPLKEIESKYILIATEARVLAYGLKARVDFGQRADVSITRDKEMTIKDEAGEIVSFNSMIDVLNFFDKYGYEFLDSYVVNETVGMGRNQEQVCYVLKKK